MKRLRILLSTLILVFTIIIAGCGGNVKVNLDLSKLSSYAVQSEVYKMQKASTAQEYIGKTIKMRAMPKADGDYHYIIGPDGDECCNWEMEIQLSEGLSSFPTTNKNTYVTGKYKYYKENGKTYYYLELLEYV